MKAIKNKFPEDSGEYARFKMGKIDLNKFFETNSRGFFFIDVDFLQIHETVLVFG